MRIDKKSAEIPTRAMRVSTFRILRSQREEINNKHGKNIKGVGDKGKKGP